MMLSSVSGFEPDKIFIQRTRDFIEKHLDVNYFQYGLLVSDEIVSTCAFRIEEYLPQVHNLVGKKALIENVFTKPEHENQGYSQHLLKHCISEITNQGIDTIELSVYEDKPRKIYEKFGFKNKESVMKWRNEK